jgi:hypothetical protein
LLNDIKGIKLIAIQALTTTTSYMQQGKKESNARFRTNTG